MENGPEIIGDESLTFGGRMDAVGLVEFRFAADVFEEKWRQGGAVFFGNIGEYFFKSGY